MRDTPKEPEPLPGNVVQLPAPTINETTLNLQELDFVDADGNRGPQPNRCSDCGGTAEQHRDRDWICNMFWCRD